MKTLSQIAPEGYVDVKELIETERKLIVHNDEFNTFEWVIETLVKVCRHSEEQAEQCAMIIHTKGKYAVKHGDFKKLKPMKEAIAERGIGVTIE
jgi:ATP-dependent Clp protease adaptor protein ClpS